ncbi:MAG TPA: ABC transporter permease [Vicinamibacteria bacterium]|nr:ABC transporter permease [Vicinamibacteria bacterium]
MPDWRAEVERRALPGVPAGREPEATEELAQHLADRYREVLEQGGSEAAAVAAALAELDGQPPVARAARRFSPGPLAEELWRDARHGLRLLARAPAFTAVAVLTLALAIGANTAVFTLVNAALIRPLPLPQPSRLVAVTESAPSLEFPVLPFSAPDYLDYERMQRSFESFGAYTVEDHDVSGGAEAERLKAAAVTAGLFPALGVAPAVGRTFTPEEDRPGSRVVVIGHGLWQRLLGGAPDVIGRTLFLDREPYTVVGVMPSGFEFPLHGPRINGDPAFLWIPAGWTAEQKELRGSQCNYTAIGRLRAGVTMEGAAAEAATIVRRVERLYPKNALELLRGRHLEAVARPLREEVVGNARAPLLVLLAAVGLVLLVACANVANLLLARGAARQRELAVRASLGADRWRLVRQGVAESLALGAFGGTAGLGLAEALRRALLAFVPVQLPLVDRAGLDGRVLAVTLALSLGSAMLFGLVPGLAAAQGPLQDVLRHDGRAGAARGLRRALRALAVAQFAFALVLLTAAFLLLRSFQALLAVDPGFEPRQAVALAATLPARGYADAGQMLAFEERLLARLASMPGVVSVGLSTDLPLAPAERRALVVESGAGDRSLPPIATQSWISGDYFRAAGIPLLAGRTFGLRDARDAALVVVVSQSLARGFWPGEDPIGKRLKWGATRAPWLTVVGVVGDVKDGRLDEKANPHTYTPILQERPDEVAADLRSVNVVVRAQAEPESLLAGIRREVAALDPALAVAGLRLLDRDLRGAVAPQRFQATLVAAFAGVGLLLAALGVYGILVHLVGQKTREIGVRMAFGAGAGDVLRMVLREGLALALAGAVLGLVASLAVVRLLRALLFGLGPYDPLAFLAATLVLVAVAAAACGVPAWRAAHIDPVVALRQEC